MMSGSNELNEISPENFTGLQKFAREFGPFIFVFALVLFQ